MKFEMADRRVAVFERLESRNLLSGVQLPSFVVEPPRSMTLAIPELTEIRQAELADADSDGNLDLWLLVETKRPGSSNVRIHRGIGDGTFEQQATDIPFEIGDALSMTLDDLNNDGLIDLELLSENKLTSMLNQSLNAEGSIEFGSLKATALPSNSGLRADLNGDGDFDLIRFGDPTNGLSIHLSDGNGGFLNPIDYFSGDTVSALAEDLDGDGDIDLLVNDLELQRAFVVRNDGSGFFESSMPTLPTVRLIEDFNGDGHPDVVADEISFGIQLSVFLNDGSGGFERKSSNEVVGFPTPIAGDVNDDGFPDMIAGHAGMGHHPLHGNSAGGTVVFLGRGDGTFSASIKMSEQTFVPILGDLDQDGHTDLVSISSEASSSRQNIETVVSHLGAASNSLDVRRTEHSAFAAPQDGITEFEVHEFFVDLTSDGRDELLLISNQGIRAIRVLSHAQFEPLFESNEPTTGTPAVGDFDGDGRIDIGFATPESILLATGNGDGSFSMPVFGNPSSNFIVGVSAGNFDADKRDELAYLTATDDFQNSLVRVFGINDQGHFQLQHEERVTGLNTNLETLDLNRDGLTDLWPYQASAELDFIFDSLPSTILLGQNDGTFEASSALYRSGKMASVHLEESISDEPVIIAGASTDDPSITMLTPTGIRASPLSRPAAGGLQLAFGNLDANRELDVVAVHSNGVVDINYDGGEIDQTLNVGYQASLAYIDDANQDGHADLIIVSGDDIYPGGIRHLVEIPVPSKITIFGGSATGILENGFEYNFPRPGNLDLQLIDLSGDGKREIVGFSNYTFSVFEFDSRSPAAGDFDGDQSLTVNDVDLLCSAIGSNGEQDTIFDLNSDSEVSREDLEVMLRDLLNTTIGDVNLDGVFNSSDLVRIFQVGRYESGAAALWSEGDWDCNGHFETGDLTAAFQQNVFRATADLWHLKTAAGDDRLNRSRRTNGFEYLFGNGSQK